MSEAYLVLLECTVFFSFLRIRCQLPALEERPISIVLLHDGREESLDRQNVRFSTAQHESKVEFTLEAMINRKHFPERYALRLGSRGLSRTVPCRDIVDLDFGLHSESIMPTFCADIEKWRVEHPGQRPRLLDIGGRARSGFHYASAFGQCDVVTADIVADKTVDVVTDIHNMAVDIGTERFDFAICVSVFEHLLMPWKAVLEINKVLKPGGAVLVQTHQTVGLHDMPWDYFRFSDASWKGLFNGHTGFTIQQTFMSSFQRIVPIHYYAAYEGFEAAGGFNESAVIAVKQRVTSLEWPVDLADLVESSYPA